MNTLYLVFFKTLDGVEINTTLRTSIWLEDNNQYLMPCEFKEVMRESNFYSIKVKVLDPQGVVSKKDLERKFLFGHPGKIIGHGILKEIEIGN